MVGPADSCFSCSLDPREIVWPLVQNYPGCLLEMHTAELRILVKSESPPRVLGVHIYLLPLLYVFIYCETYSEPRQAWDS